MKSRLTLTRAYTTLLALAAFTSWSGEALADRALIIAIGDYRSDPDIPPLRGPAEDARLMRELAIGRLAYKPQDVKVLRDAEATRDGILKAIDEWLVAGTRPGERVLLHYSGHGAQIPDESGDENDKLDEVLVAVDARVDRKSEKRRIEGLILDDEIESLLKKLADRQVTFVVDSCNSGTVTRAALGLLEDAPIRTPLELASFIDMPARGLGVVAAHREEPPLVSGGKGLTVWTAVSAYQEALDDVEVTPRSGHFTNRFVKALTSSAADRNGDGRTAHAELLDWLRTESEAYCRRNRRICRFGLMPTLEADPALLTQPVEVTLLNQSPPEQTPTQATQIALAPPQQFTAGVKQVTIRIHHGAADASVHDYAVCPRSGCSLLHGENVRIEVESSFDGYLTLLEINPAGELIQLFPNAYGTAKNPQGRIHSGRPLTVPDAYYGFRFPVEPPLGNGTLIALVTEDHIDLTDIVDAKRGLAPVPKAPDYLSKIAERLREPWTGDEFNREAFWALGEAAYTSRE